MMTMTMRPIRRHKPLAKRSMRMVATIRHERPTSKDGKICSNNNKTTYPTMKEDEQGKRNMYCTMGKEIWKRRYNERGDLTEVTKWWKK